MELSPSSQHDTMCKAAIIQCQRPSARARHAVVGRLAYRLWRQRVTAPAITVKMAPLAPAIIAWPMMGP